MRTPRTRAATCAWVAAGLLLTGCTAGASTSGGTTPPALTPGATKSAQASASSSPSSGQAAGGTLAQVPDLVRRLEPSVVTIFTSIGLGSGVVYKANGTIVTNEHVIRGAQEVTVAFADGRRVPGEVLASDIGTDLAVVRTERTGLPVPTYQQKLPEVGELAIALGSPLGFQNTATAGIVSGLGREIPGSASQSSSLVDLIQTDAAISPGNSGGALINGTGEVVGINDAYLPPTSGAVSIGFAIPSATVVDVADQLLATGKVTSPYLGVALKQITAEIAQQFRIEQPGVLVQAVEPGSPAAQAGLEPGDVLTGIGGARVRSVEEFLGELRRLKIGQQVALVRVRNGTPETVTLTLGSRTN